MKASIVDLRYHMSAIRKAISQNEVVKITCHGHVIANIVPCGNEEKNKVEDHPFFGSQQDIDVEAVMNKLRGNRYDVI